MSSEENILAYSIKQKEINYQKLTIKDEITKLEGC